MNCKVENGKFIVEINGKTYSFNAHGEEPRPSMLGMGLTVAGKHWSNRDENIKLEKHTSIQSGAVNEKYLAWYTQEFIPDGLDYKVNKNARIYLGNLETGEDRLIYKGECYGDLRFDGDDLYFNMGNKIAVIDLQSGETTVLFKHSGRKKNGVPLKITPHRIFFSHWTKNKFYLMWYNRETKEVINPHIDCGRRYYLLDDNTVLYQTSYHSWYIDVNTLKKKRFLNNAKMKAICKLICDFFEIPQEYYKNELYATLEDRKDNKLYFKCESGFDIENLNYTQNIEMTKKLKLPRYIKADIIYDLDTGDICIAGDKNQIIKEPLGVDSSMEHWIIKADKK
ncbi:MAG: hypothetical protein UHK60_01410 [Acutalibacteraceae bacterium]|nr:hypothetical protein [Acutalibacteraceae bacterium]